MGCRQSWWTAPCFRSRSGTIQSSITDPFIILQIVTSFFSSIIFFFKLCTKRPIQKGLVIRTIFIRNSWGLVIRNFIPIPDKFRITRPPCIDKKGFLTFVNQLWTSLACWYHKHTQNWSSTFRSWDKSICLFLALFIRGVSLTGISKSFRINSG